MYDITSKKEVVQIVEDTKKVSLSEYVGIKVKELRESKGLRVADIEKAMLTNPNIKNSVSHTTITNIEKGISSAVRLDVIESIGVVLGVSIDYFIPKVIQ